MLHNNVHMLNVELLINLIMLMIAPQLNLLKKGFVMETFETHSHIDHAFVRAPIYTRTPGFEITKSTNYVWIY